MAELNTNKIVTREQAVQLAHQGQDMCDHIVTEVNKVNADASTYADSDTVKSLGEATRTVYEAAKFYLTALKSAVSIDMMNQMIQTAQATNTPILEEAATEIKNAYNALEVATYQEIECKVDGDVYPTEKLQEAVNNMGSLCQIYLEGIQSNRPVFQEIADSQDVYNNSFGEMYNSLGTIIDALQGITAVMRQGTDASIEAFQALNKKLAAQATDNMSVQAANAAVNMGEHGTEMTKKLKSIENAL